MHLTRVRPVRALASLSALLTNLKQLSEVSQPNGTALPHYEVRWRETAESVAMEFGQVQAHLGIEAGNPGWTHADPHDSQPLGD